MEENLVFIVRLAHRYPEPMDNSIVEVGLVSTVLLTFNSCYCTVSKLMGTNLSVLNK